jgi:hypothetical protein
MVPRQHLRNASIFAFLQVLWWIVDSTIDEVLGVTSEVLDGTRRSVFNPNFCCCKGTLHQRWILCQPELLVEMLHELHNNTTQTPHKRHNNTTQILHNTKFRKIYTNFTQKEATVWEVVLRTFDADTLPFGPHRELQAA